MNSILQKIIEEEAQKFDEEFNSRITPTPFSPERTLEWQTERDKSIKAFLASSQQETWNAAIESVKGEIKKLKKDSSYFKTYREDYNEAIKDVLSLLSPSSDITKDTDDDIFTCKDCGSKKVRTRGVGMMCPKCKIKE